MEKKFSLCATKKNILTLVLSEKKILNKTKNQTPPPLQDKWSVTKNSLIYTAAVLWNNLPDDLRKIANCNQFKNIFLSWSGNECKCNAYKQF